jgi:hypothetical protein
MICRKRFPDALHHLHHKKPKSLGGTDDPSNLVNLDHACHNNLHLLAYMMANPARTHEVEPTVASIFPTDPEARRALIEYAGWVAREMALKKEIRKEASAEVRTSIDLPARYLELIRLAGYEKPHPDGRPSGVARMVRSWVARALLEKFPQHRDEIIALQKPKR